MASKNYRGVQENFWMNAKVRNKYTLQDKIVFLYLLTNPNTSWIGIYQIPFTYIEHDTGLTLQEVEQSMAHLEELDSIKYSKETEEVAILNYFRDSTITTGKNMESMYGNFETKVRDKELVRAVYKKLQKVTDKRQAFQYVFNQVKSYVNTYCEEERKPISTKPYPQSPMYKNNNVPEENVPLYDNYSEY